eukprot:GFKZ01006660.1.p1 GENE.GFKZ01006660.1~~GFKZ01006660.1.p1  ORF type:complete len:558 (+),score=84.96 GFKZ01006660.1:594-2267(+)
MSGDQPSSILSKRARLGKNFAEPKSKRLPAARLDRDDYLELCSLLLQKAGTNLSANPDHDAIHSLLAHEYSPRVAELLSKMTTALDKESIFQTDSDVTDGSDDEDADAVVPAALKVPSVATDRVRARSDAVVPGYFGAQIVKAPKPVQEKQPKVQTAYNKETEIAISRIFDLGKVKSVADPSIPADAPYTGHSVVTMTGFGELGRFGNQVFQYMFLKSFAAANYVKEIQVPGWVGSGLFGLNDREVQRQLPAAVEFRDTKANSTFTVDLIDYVKNSRPGKDVPDLSPEVLTQGTGGAAVNKDIWGWFQWHTSHFAPFKKMITDTFTPVEPLRAHCKHIFEEKVRYRGGQKHTVVGLHLRLGDYQNIAASSFGYCAPTSWYLELLAKIWPSLENPVLFVASDDVNAVLRDFVAYSPITADSIGMKVPDSMKGLKAGFFPDWFGLTLCDVVAISNSTFSFSACMLNQMAGAKFYRAHFRERMVEFDPWNADPIVHRDMSKIGIAKVLETLQVVYSTQGSRGLARNLLYEIPYYGVRAAIMKAVLWRQAAQKANGLQLSA